MWLQDRDGNSDSKNATEQHRLAQHWLIADQLYPQLETDNTYYFAVAHRFGSKWMRKVREQHKHHCIREDVSLRFVPSLLSSIS